MKEYDYLIIGGGTAGLTVLSGALAQKATVALVEKGRLGGTCHNTGCVPSKMLVHHADLVMTIGRAAGFGIQAGITVIDFGKIMETMRTYLGSSRKQIEAFVRGAEGPAFYPAEGRFVDEYTLEIEGERIRGRHIFIASGSRDMTPPITGLDTVEPLTTASLLELGKRPESLVIVGGGYTAVEYAHFFASMGTAVTILQNSDRLVPHEEPDISDLLKRELERRMEVHTNTTAVEAGRDGGGCVVVGRDAATKQRKEFRAEKVLIAVGRESNAERLRVEKTGIETDGKNYITVDDYFETSKKNIWAVGDAIDRLMFTHSGDREAEIAWHNATHAEKLKMNFAVVPHAVYTHPRIASVGMTEAQATKRHDVLVGTARYADVVMGDILREEGFAKIVVEKGSGTILGFHVVGPEAPLLLQEVVTVMARGGGVEDITAGLHIFPSLSELVPETLKHLKAVEAYAGA